MTTTYSRAQERFQLLPNSFIYTKEDPLHGGKNIQLTRLKLWLGHTALVPRGLMFLSMLLTYEL